MIEIDMFVAMCYDTGNAEGRVFPSEKGRPGQIPERRFIKEETVVKKILALVIALVLCLGMIPFAQAEAVKLGVRSVLLLRPVHCAVG